MIGKIARKSLDVVQAPKPIRKGTGELRTGSFDTVGSTANEGIDLAEDLARDGF